MGQHHEYIHETDLITLITHFYKRCFVPWPVFWLHEISERWIHLIFIGLLIPLSLRASLIFAHFKANLRTKCARKLEGRGWLFWVRGNKSGIVLIFNAEVQNINFMAKSITKALWNLRKIYIWTNEQTNGIPPIELTITARSKGAYVFLWKNTLIPGLTIRYLKKIRYLLKKIRISEN